MPLVPPRIFKASMILVKSRGYIKVTMAKYTPRKERQGKSRSVQINAPDKPARGMAR